MDRYKVIVLSALTALMLSGCVYESNFTCEGFKNAGRACKPTSSNIEHAIESDGKDAAEKEPEAAAPGKKSDGQVQELFVKCAEDEMCDYKPADDTRLYLNDEAEKYLQFKKDENKLLADELTSYGVRINPDAVPVTTKPKVLRVTILPYEDSKGRLNMQRRVYMILQKSEWILGDYLNVDDRSVDFIKGQ